MPRTDTCSILDVVQKYLNSWFHLNVIIFHPYTDIPSADLVVMDDSDNRAGLSVFDSRIPKIVLQYRHMWEARKDREDSNGRLVFKPAGPKRLAIALKAIFEESGPDGAASKTSEHGQDAVIADEPTEKILLRSSTQDDVSLPRTWENCQYRLP